jgi:hypothetical protein
MLVAAVVLIVSAYLVPAVIYRSNASAFIGEERTFAQFALKEARKFIGGSLEPVYVTSMQIIELEKLPSKKPLICGYSHTFTVSKTYTAKVKMYAWFGKPYGEMQVHCGGVAWIKRY